MYDPIIRQTRIKRINTFRPEIRPEQNLKQKLVTLDLCKDQNTLHIFFEWIFIFFFLVSDEDRVKFILSYKSRHKSYKS